MQVSELEVWKRPNELSTNGFASILFPLIGAIHPERKNEFLQLSTVQFFFYYSIWHLLNLQFNQEAIFHSIIQDKTFKRVTVVSDTIRSALSGRRELWILIPPITLNIPKRGSATGPESQPWSTASIKRITPTSTMPSILSKKPVKGCCLPLCTLASRSGMSNTTSLEILATQMPDRIISWTATA